MRDRERKKEKKKGKKEGRKEKKERKSDFKCNGVCPLPAEKSPKDLGHHTQWGETPSLGDRARPCLKKIKKERSVFKKTI